jgi:hypothetical protein
MTLTAAQHSRYNELITEYGRAWRRVWDYTKKHNERMGWTTPPDIAADYAELEELEKNLPY